MGLMGSIIESSYDINIQRSLIFGCRSKDRGREEFASFCFPGPIPVIFSNGVPRVGDFSIHFPKLSARSTRGRFCLLAWRGRASSAKCVTVHAHRFFLTQIYSQRFSAPKVAS